MEGVKEEGDKRGGWRTGGMEKRWKERSGGIKIIEEASERMKGKTKWRG